eukprot:jgi/Chlat1/6167/Chrsp41S05712
MASMAAVAQVSSSSFLGARVLDGAKPASASAPRLAASRRRLQTTTMRASMDDVLRRSAELHTSHLWTPSSPTNSIVSGKNLPEPYSNSFRAAQGQGPPPEMASRFQGVLSGLFQQRIIRLGGPVDDDMANVIVAQLLYLDAVDPKKDIVIYINSPGGSVTAGMAIFDTMNHIRPDVSTVCSGLAASMGAFLLSAGKKGKRYSLPNSRIMIHQPLGGTQGQATDIEIQANEIMHHKITLNKYLALHTGQSEEQVDRDTDRDFFMSPEEAIEYGMIDGIITNPRKSPGLPKPKVSLPKAATTWKDIEEEKKLMAASEKGQFVRSKAL